MWFEHYKEDDLKFYYTNERSLKYIPISESYVCTITQGGFQDVTPIGILRNTLLKYSVTKTQPQLCIVPVY